MAWVGTLFRIAILGKLRQKSVISDFDATVMTILMLKDSALQRRREDFAKPLNCVHADLDSQQSLQGYGGN